MVVTTTDCQFYHRHTHTQTNKKSAVFTSQTTKLKSVKQVFKFAWPSQSYKTLNSYWLYHNFSKCVCIIALHFKRNNISCIMNIESVWSIVVIQVYTNILSYKFIIVFIFMFFSWNVYAIETPHLSKWTCIYTLSVATLCQVSFCSFKDSDDSKCCLWRFRFELEITFDLFYV